MAIGTVKGNSVHNSRSGMKYRVARGGKYDARKLNGMFVEYRLGDAPLVASTGQGRRDIRVAIITKPLKRAPGQGARR